MKCETCLNSRIGISENGYHCVCTLSAKKAANCITNDYKYYVKSPLDIPQKSITNADRIRSMSDEKLARWIALHPCLPSCPAQTEECFKTSKFESCTERWLDWLRQAATE